MSDPSIRFLASEVRTRTLRLLQGLSDEQARFAPSGLNNTILWYAGHCYIVAEHLAIAPATEAPAQEPPGWFEKFSWDSNPALVTEWPTIAEVAARLREQFHRLMTAIDGLTPEQLNRVTPEGILRDVIVHGLHDEAQHQGEMFLLKKMLVKGRR
jgi:hypothetical protein